MHSPHNPKEKKKNSDNKTVPKTILLNQLLQKLNKKGKFPASILAAESGLVIAETRNENSKKL